MGVGGVGWWYTSENLNPVSVGKIESQKLEKYDFDNLRKLYREAENEGQTHRSARTLEILGEIPQVIDRRKLIKDRKHEEYRFQTREIRFKSGEKWISGMMNYYPNVGAQSITPVPVIIMIRGFAESAGYYPGSGSWRAADELAREGYTTISLDFLGYGHSEAESTDILEARFDKVVQVLDLLETVKAQPWVDKNKIGFWAHSNGGQITLSVLEITGERYPTVLWAPMTQKFPDSVLSTNDPDSPIHAILGEFMKHYDTRRYAFENYYSWIKAPVLIQQGTRDEWCQVEWQQEVIRGIGREDAQLVVYEGADHNMGGSPPAGGGEIWKEAIKKDILWFRSKFGV